LFDTWLLERAASRVTEFAFVSRSDALCFLLDLLKRLSL
jgi:hypothetical protein